MKYVKMLGLAAVAAAALMAFVGASTASATILCTEPGTGSPTGTTCPEKEAYGETTTIHAVLDTGTTADLTNEKGEVAIRCTSSTVEGKTTDKIEEAEVLDGAVSTLTWGGCSSPQLFNEPCTVTTVKGGTLTASWISGTHNGTIKSDEAEVTAQCTGIITMHCIFVTGETHLGVLTGGKPATMDIESALIPQKETSSLCPESARWDAKYSVTTPNPLYVAGHT